MCKRTSGAFGILVDKGMCADWSIHDSENDKGQRNLHIHVRKKCMTGIPLMSARYYMIQFMQETLSWQKDRPRPCVPRKDSISRLQSRPPVIGESSSGYDNIFRGIIKCADCGSAMHAKVEQKRKRNNVIEKTFYCCTKYRKFGKEGCSSHNIEARTVHEVVLADIQKHAQQALTDRKAMVTDIAERLNLQLSADKEQQSKDKGT